MEISGIKDRPSLEAYLEDKPVEWSQAIAVRAALRVMPSGFLPSNRTGNEPDEKLVQVLLFLLFRTVFVPTVSVMWPSIDLKPYAAAAARAVNGQRYISDRLLSATYAAYRNSTPKSLDAAVAAATAVSALSISSAASSAASCAASATFAARNSAAGNTVIAAAAELVWEGTRKDLSYIHRTSQLPQRSPAEEVQVLMNSHLWMFLDDEPPGVFGLRNLKFEKSALVRETSFGLIAHWYRRVLQGGSAFGEEIDVAIAQMKPEEWGDGIEDFDPMIAMDRVAEIAGWKNSPVLTMADFIPQSLDAAEEPLSIDDFVDLFDAAGFKSRRESIRGRLNELSQRGQILRVGRGLYSSLYYNPENDEDDTQELPKPDELPGQNPLGTPISSFREGPLKPAKDPPTLGDDPEQQALYEEVHSLFNGLVAHFPSQDLGECKGMIDQFLSLPENLNDVEFAKVLWLRGNIIRSRLARHDAVADEEIHFDKLSPAVAEALRAPVEAWNVLVIGDQKLRELDAQRRGPREFSELKAEADAAKPVLEAAALDREITREVLAEYIEMQVELAEAAVDNIHGDQALKVANATSQNINGELLSGAYQTVLMFYRGLPVEVKVAGGIAGGGFAAAIGADAWASVKSSWTFVEFIAVNPEIMKHYLATAYGNPALERVVDFIKLIYNRYKP